MLWAGSRLQTIGDRAYYSTRVQMLVQPTACFSEVVFCEILSDAIILKSGLLAFHEQERKRVLRNSNNLKTHWHPGKAPRDIRRNPSLVTKVQ